LKIIFGKYLLKIEWISKIDFLKYGELIKEIA